MNTLKFGAIALVLIIACPIILGYAMASDEVEYTKTTETDSSAITETMLNSESDYFVNYSKLNNNSTMIQRVTAQGSTYYVYASPDYVSTSSTYSSIPAYETTSYTATYSSSDIANTYTATINSGDPNKSVGIAIGDYDALTSDWTGFNGVVSGTHTSSYYSEYVSIDSSYPTFVFIESLTDVSYSPSEGTTAGGIAASSVSWVWDDDNDNWIFTVGSTQYSGDWAYICCGYYGTYTWNQYDYDTIAPSYGGESVDNWVLTLDNPGYVKLTFADGSVAYRYATDSVSNTPSFTMVDDESFNEVSTVGVSFIGSAVLEYFTQSYTDYANPSYGWYNAEAPDLTNPVYYNAWFNQYQNATVTMYVAFEGNGETVFYEDFDMISPVVDIKRVDGEVILTDSDLNTTSLGIYQYVQVFFNTIDDSVTVSGIAKMPSMGVVPELYNSVTLDYEYDDYIEQLVIVDQFSTITAVTADYYAENNESVTIEFETARPYYSLELYDSDGEEVTSGWAATLSTTDYKTVTFTPTALADGLYTFLFYGPQLGGEEVTIYIGDVSTFTTSPIAYRVDSATIVAGDYPSTVDYTLDIYSLFPNDTTQIIYLNSIGVYGDSLTVAGNSYTVTDNSITITDIDSGDSVTVKLLKTTIKMVNDDDTYATYINGYHVADTTAAPTIYFGGEWSLTATRCTVTEETGVKSEWVAGEFAFDTDDFVLAMCLTAVGAFVVLGMTGARSGAKVALLALICGGACAVGFMMI